MITVEDIKVMFEVQQKAYKDIAELLMADMNGKMKSLEQQNQELLHSLEFTQREVDSLKIENKSLKEDLHKVKGELNKVIVFDEKIRKINDRLDYQEDYSRRNNLRFDGVEEKPNETWEETEDRIQRVLRDKLNLGAVRLERAHRVGPRVPLGSNRPRTVVARFTSFGDRQEALRNSSKLKNTHIYINEDLCETSVQLRKAQLPELKKARQEGKIAYFSHTKLIIRDRREQQSGDETVSSQPSGGQGTDSGLVAAAALTTTVVATATDQTQQAPSRNLPEEAKDRTGARSKGYKKTKK